MQGLQHNRMRGRDFSRPFFVSKSCVIINE
nr:MAG TPA: hypothetical protein [Caudoviricetes sp.]